MIAFGRAVIAAPGKKRRDVRDGKAHALQVSFTRHAGDLPRVRRCGQHFGCAPMADAIGPPWAVRIGHYTDHTWQAAGQDRRALTLVRRDNDRTRFGGSLHGGLKHGLVVLVRRAQTQVDDVDVVLEAPIDRPQYDRDTGRQPAVKYLHTKQLSRRMQRMDQRGNSSAMAQGVLVVRGCGIRPDADTPGNPTDMRMIEMHAAVEDGDTCGTSTHCSTATLLSAVCACEMPASANWPERMLARVNSSAGLPCSTMRPSSRTTTRSAAPTIDMR